MKAPSNLMTLLLIIIAFIHSFIYKCDNRSRITKDTSTASAATMDDVTITNSCSIPSERSDGSWAKIPVGRNSE